LSGKLMAFIFKAVPTCIHLLTVMSAPPFLERFQMLVTF